MPVPSVTNFVVVAAGLRFSGSLRIFVGHASGKVSGVITAGFTNGSLLYLLELWSVLILDSVHEPRAKETSSKIT